MQFFVLNAILVTGIAFISAADGSYVCSSSVCKIANPDYQNTKWMGQISDPTRLIDMSLPGTHNTMALHDKLAFGWARCQSMKLKTQLSQGIRVLDIRCRHIGDAFAMHHGRVFQDAWFGRDVLKVCIDFVKENPTETILLNVQKEHTEVKNTRTFRETLKWYINIYGGEKYFLDIDRMSGFVKLGDARGKIVINTRYDYKYHQGKTLEQNQWKETGKTKFHLIRDLFEKSFITPTSANVLFVNYLSCSKPILIWNNPYYQAKYQNKRAGKLLESKASAPRRVGIVYMDFPGGSLLTSVIRLNIFKQKRRQLKWNSIGDVTL